VQPGHHEAGRERLGHVVVGSEPEAAQLVGLGVARGQHHDRHARRCADAPAQLEPVEAGEAEVE
jgi:hypothetical protein